MYSDKESFKNLRNIDKSLILRNNYKSWKFNSLDNVGYFIVFQGFEESKKLKNISGNALKLYIFLGIHANNYEGIVWYSTKTIANYFEKSERTIRAWLKELDDMELITRMRLKYDGTVYTYLLPYKAKLENTFISSQGIIYFNEYTELCFQNEFNSKVLRDDLYYITVCVDEENLVRGELKRDSKDEEVYNFKSDDGKVVFRIDYKDNPEMVLKVYFEG